MATNLNAADGQVAATATQILAGEDNARRYNLTFSNVGTTEQTLVLTLSRNSGTARRVRRVVLAVNEQLDVFGLAVDKRDSLLAQATDASSVDYVVSAASDQTPYGAVAYDDSGNPKTAPAVIDQLAQIFG